MDTEQRPKAKSTRKYGEVSLHPLTFEDALRGLLTTEPADWSAVNDELPPPDLKAAEKGNVGQTQRRVVTASSIT